MILEFEIDKELDWNDEQRYNEVKQIIEWLIDHEKSLHLTLSAQQQVSSKTRVKIIRDI